MSVPWWLFERWERERIEALRSQSREEVERERRHRPDDEGDEPLLERQKGMRYER